MDIAAWLRGLGLPCSTAAMAPVHNAPNSARCPRGQPTGWGVPGGARPPWASSILQARLPRAPDFRKRMGLCPLAPHGPRRLTLPASRGGRLQISAVALIQRQGLQLDCEACRRYTSRSGSRSPGAKRRSNRTAVRTTLAGSGKSRPIGRYCSTVAVAWRDVGDVRCAVGMRDANIYHKAASGG